MSHESLETAIRRTGSPVAFLRNAAAEPFTFPVPPQFSNWRSEQLAWRESCVLFDQSHHMTDLFLEGPDALRLLSELAVNSFASYRPEMGKQFVAVDHAGYVIGDGILFYLGDESFDLVGIQGIANWVDYNARHCGYDLTVERDDHSGLRKDRPPRLYRYELQGPTASAVVERLVGGPLPEVGFFRMARFSFAGTEVRALRHGMAGQPGFELFGRWKDGERVLAAILEAGAEHGLVRAGAMAYSTSNLESGWVPTPPAAIFGDELRAYREWLPAAAAGSLGGSFASERIEDYYVTPYDLAYGSHVSFDHDFVGREALQRHAEEQRRTKVTLVWNADDLTAAVRTLLEEGPKAKYIELPKARYALYQVDSVLVDDDLVGLSFDCGYVATDSAFLSLATIDVEHAVPGTEVTVLWGEDPNSAKPAVERHRQVAMRATVAPAPFSEFARTGYRARAAVV